MQRTRRATASLVPVAASMLVAALLLIVGPAFGTTGAKVSSSGPYAVGVTRCTFVDRTRGVLNYSTNPVSTLANSRRLVTEIRYPTRVSQPGVSESAGAIPSTRIGGFPMIVFAHGYDVTPDTYAPLLDAWAKAGFVVTAPFFPAESSLAVAKQHQANTENDLWNEPADLAFVTVQILRASAGTSLLCPLVRGLVNPTQLGLAGHSDGGTAVAMLSYAQGHDPQGVTYQALRAPNPYQGTVVMSGREDGIDPYLPIAPNPALLVIQSAADQCNPAATAVRLYNDLHQSRKWFLELLTAHHLPPFDGADARAFGVVERSSLRFFQIALQGATPSSSLMAVGNQLPQVAHMTFGGRGPAMPNAPSRPVYCGTD